MLKISNVSVTLDEGTGQAEILKDINLTLEEKKLYVMTGPNGGGKSSLAKAIMGIYRPVSGRIFLDDIDITDLSITERARLGIGYAFQQPPYFKGLRVRDFLDIAKGGEKETKSCDLLYSVGLCAQDYIDREINASFSGGELKRIEIASVLARKWNVVLFDEPEAGIDLWSFQKLTEAFRNLNEKLDTTIVIISHQERILSLADQVILVSDGRIKEITSKEKVLGDIQKLDLECKCGVDCIRRGYEVC